MASEAPATPTADDKARYEALKRQLATAIPKKRAVDLQLAQLESHIYNLETAYLQETAAHSGGNIIHGFEGYLKNQSLGRRRADVQEHDRLFSTSSSSYIRSLDLLGDAEDTPGIDSATGTPNPNGGLTTVVLPAANSYSSTGGSRKEQSTYNGTQQKRVKDREYARKRRAASRVSAGTVSGEEDSVGSGAVVSGQSISGRRLTKRARIADDE